MSLRCSNVGHGVAARKHPSHAPPNRARQVACGRGPSSLLRSSCYRWLLAVRISLCPLPFQPASLRAQRAAPSISLTRLTRRRRPCGFRLIISPTSFSCARYRRKRRDHDVAVILDKSQDRRNSSRSHYTGATLMRAPELRRTSTLLLSGRWHSVYNYWLHTQ